MSSESNLYREIFEQPEAISRLFELEWPNVRQLAQFVKDRGIKYVVIAARGTSDNAAIYAKYLLGLQNHLTVALATPSLFSLYRQPPLFTDALVLGISQSGRSPDIRAVLAEARKQGALTAVFTNTPGSELAQLGDVVINLQAGPEKAVAATKSYTTSLAAIAMLSVALNGDDALTTELAAMPEAIARTLAMDEGIARIAPRYRYMNRCVVIGRGFSYATAFEMALKLKELTYTIVEPYSSADFQHGPMALLEPGFPVILVAPSGVLEESMVAFLDALNKRQAESLVISDVARLLEKARIPLELPQPVPEWLSPMVTIVPGQLLALHLASARDYDIDSPRGLSKVTKTQ